MQNKICSIIVNSSQRKFTSIGNYYTRRAKLLTQNVKMVNFGDQKCTKISEVTFSAFVYRLFHEDFSSVIRTNTDCVCFYD